MIVLTIYHVEIKTIQLENNNHPTPPNMPHCIKDLSCWNNNKLTIRRSLIFFLLFDNEMNKYNNNISNKWNNNISYKWILNCKHDIDEFYDDNADTFWKYIIDCGQLPIITASNILPMDEKHLKMLFKHILYTNVKQVLNILLPEIVIGIIKSFIVNEMFLKNEEALFNNSVSMRENRGYGDNKCRFDRRIVWMN
eukprot:169755_1